MKHKKFFLLFLIPSLVFSQYPTKINSLSNSYWLGLGGGTNYYSGDFNKSKFGFYGRGEIEYLFESYSRGIFGIKLFSGYGALQGKSSYPISIGNPARNSIDFVDYFFDGGAGLTFLLNYGVLNPYFSAGGYSTFWYKVLDENRNNAYDKKRDVALGFYGETGFKLKLSDGLTLNLAVLFNYPNTDEIDGRVSSKKDVFGNILGGFSVYFGGLKDSDFDGIPDRFDLCPNSPIGVKVDKFGCPESKLKDSDGDGVLDDSDKCPDTPIGVIVDKNGCPLDSDGDGVPDYIDRCPGTPKEFPTDEKGCPLDSDNDGVLDIFDKCPNTPKEVKVDDYGCPFDSDGDGVQDYLDLCPDTPQGVKVDSNGCPVEEKDKIEEISFVMQGLTTFETGKSTLTETAKQELKRLAEIILKHPDSRWRIEGHTDSQGSAEFNKKLSQQRADVVKEYLISLGVPEKMLDAEGMGEQYPIADNKTETGRQKNRRVVITKIK